MIQIRTTWALLFLMLLPGQLMAITIKIEAGQYDRIGVPVRCPVPEGIPANHPFILISNDTNERVPTQLDKSTDYPMVTWMLEQPLYSDQSRSYRVVLVDGIPKRIQRVSTEQSDGAIKVRVGEKPVLEYNVDIRPCPDPAQAVYARSGFIHPVYDPAGNVLTDDFPPDHYHQHGIMFPYKRTTFRGDFVNFWEQSAELGNVFHREVTATVTGPVFGGFITGLDHVAFPETDKQVTALKESWRVQVYKSEEVFLVDFTSRQQCATDDMLVIQKNHYGGFAIRGRRNWREGGNFLTSESKDRSNGNHTRPNWVDIHGPVPSKADGADNASGDTHSGISIICHPDNFRAPQPVRLHPKMPYFCFSPMVLGEFNIEPQRPLVSRYRLVIHQGKIKPDEINRYYQDFGHPIKVSLEK